MDRQASPNHSPNGTIPKAGGDFSHPADRERQVRMAGEILYRSASFDTTPDRSRLNSYNQNYGTTYPPIGLPAPEPWVSENNAACCGVMSPVRRTFCLFVAFDFLFTFIMWVIYTQILGLNLFMAFDCEVGRYTFYYSLFDTVLCSACRLVPLLLAYGLFRINNPSAVAVTTFGTCVFLLCKVFIFKFTAVDKLCTSKSHDNVICYSLLVISFVLAWAETWFLDFKVLPQERKVRHREALYRPYSAHSSLLESGDHRAHNDHFQSLPESSGEESDDERGEFRSLTSTRNHSRSHSQGSLGLSLGVQEQEYLRKGDEAWDKTWEIISTNEGWKLEAGKDLHEGQVYTRSFAKMGKLFKIEAYVDASPQACFDELVLNQANSPQWNPTVSEARILQIINDTTDVLYNVAAEAAGGLVSSRDFVTLRRFGERNGCLVATGAAVSHPDAPPTKKHVRGENRPGGWAFKPVHGNKNRCLLVWVINTDLKGWVPQYAVDQALSGVLLTFIKNFRQRMKIVRGTGEHRR